MRLSIYWQGKPLFAFDLTAQSPESDPTDDGPTMQATGGGQFEHGQPMQPDTPVFGYGTRPQGRA